MLNNTKINNNLHQEKTGIEITPLHIKTAEIYDSYCYPEMVILFYFKFKKKLIKIM